MWPGPAWQWASNNAAPAGINAPQSCVSPISENSRVQPGTLRAYKSTGSVPGKRQCYEFRESSGLQPNSSRVDFARALGDRMKECYSWYRCIRRQHVQETLKDNNPGLIYIRHMQGSLALRHCTEINCACCAPRVSKAASLCLSSSSIAFLASRLRGTNRLRSVVGLKASRSTPNALSVFNSTRLKSLASSRLKLKGAFQKRLMLMNFNI